MSKQYPVVATAVGQYGKHRRVGASFVLAQRADFAPSWMRAVGWDPNEPEPEPEPELEVDPTASIRSRVADLEAENEELRDIGSRASTAAAKLQDRVAELEKETAHDKAVFDDIRASLVKVVGLPADLKLSEAVAWMADRLSATNASAGAAEQTGKSKTSTKKE